MSALSQFLVALEAAKRGRTFVCPATGLSVSLTAPSYAQTTAARAAVEAAWADREVGQLNLGQYLDDIDRALLGLVARVDGELLGAETIGELDEQTFTSYAAELRALRDDTGEAMSDDDMAAALDELKKKRQTAEATLSGFDSRKLRSLLLYTAGQLWTLQTSNSAMPSH